MKVLFVCTGNTCRSPMAEHLFRKMVVDADRSDIQVNSAGTSPATWLPLPDQAREVLAKEGILELSHQAKGLNESLVSESDLILTMEQHQCDHVIADFPAAKDKVHQLKVYAGLNDSYNGVLDPFGQSVEVYQSTLEEIKKSLSKIVEKI